MDICNKISSFLQTFFKTNTSAVVVRNSYMDKFIHNDEFLSEHNLCSQSEESCDCEKNLDLSEKLEEIIQILEEVKDDDNEEDENVFYDEAYEDKEKENKRGKISII
jgi:hypothetical protein